MSCELSCKDCNCRCNCKRGCNKCLLCKFRKKDLHGPKEIKA